MIGSLHDILVEVCVVLVHGFDQFVVFQVHSQFAHVNQLIFLGSFAGNIKIVVSLDEHALDVSERFPDVALGEGGLIVKEPSPIEGLKLEKNV